MAKNKLKAITTILILLGITLAPYLVSADAWEVGPPPGGLPDIELEQVVLNVTNWALGIIGFLAVLFLIWGGLNYVTASGSEEKIENAKSNIKYALLGLVTSGISYAAVKVIVDVFVK